MLRSIWFEYMNDCAGFVVVPGIVTVEIVCMTAAFEIIYNMTVK
jgi:hypothetical protein